jgi:transcriptional regulator with XRE-family HTH domain
MPAQPSPENARNPLRQLRELLSGEGKKKPMTQEELAELLNISAATVKGIERGFRGLTLSVHRRVVHGTSAQWDPDKEKWVCGYDLDEKTGDWSWSDKSRPFTYAVFCRFRKDRELRPANANLEEAKMGARLMKLFILIPDYKWWSLALRFGEFVEEVWDEYDGDRLEELYNSITASKEDYLRVYQERLAKMKLTRPTRARTGKLRSSRDQ